jgi:outer membrane immunogenic protein
MKKFFVASVAAAAFCGAPVLAAPPAAPLFSWSGFYTGLNAGYGWGQSNTMTVMNDPGAANFALAFQPFYNANMSPRLHPDGFVGGGQIGHNWQSGSVVVGLETDFQFFNLNETKLTTFNPGPGNGSTLFTHTTVGTDWLFTARARGGIASDRTLLYVTGGLASTNLKYAQNNFFTPCGGPGGACVEAVSASKTKTGWTVGGGLDYMLNNSWSLRAEYLYLDFGSISAVGFDNTVGRPYNHSANFTANIVRTAINYKY